jgi:hypothetical protein
VDVCGGHVCWHLGDVALAGGRSSSLAGGATPPLRPAMGTEFVVGCRFVAIRD